VSFTTSGDLGGAKTWTINIVVNATNYSIVLTNSSDVEVSQTTNNSLVYQTSTSGTYTATITSPNGCTFTEEIILD
jgi:hypothetical protein